MFRPAPNKSKIELLKLGQYNVQPALRQTQCKEQGKIGELLKLIADEGKVIKSFELACRRTAY
jgi:hypothetical protein